VPITFACIELEAFDCFIEQVYKYNILQAFLSPFTLIRLKRRALHPITTMRDPTHCCSDGRGLTTEQLNTLYVERRSTNVVNTWSPQGELPLELALRARNSSIATTLVEHGADVNAKDSEGDVLIHRAIKKEYAFGALFLLKHNCDVSSTTR
ncbi:unnamed protein product, partial [Acanthoscelides obtectus]